MFNKAFQGGVVIPNPYPVATVEVVQAPLPDKVILPLQQRIGDDAIPCVKVGDRVLTGQVIAKTNDYFCVPIHASISGTVSAIENQLIADKSALKCKCIIIESDGKDQWIEQYIGQIDESIDFLQITPEKLIKTIQDCGLVGLGGAGFPTHVKLARVEGCHTLIINGTECEPGIMCDDALMQHHPREILRAVEIVLHICGAKRAIIVIEDDKQEAWHSLLKHNHNAQIDIVQIPTKYSSGAEKLLIKTLLNVEVPCAKVAIDVGVVCQNIATTKAIFDAVIAHKPLVSRIVTVTGSAVQTPNNYEVRLGASFEHITALSKPNNGVHKIRMGGMMMGVDVSNTDVPIGKITNCIFVNNMEPQPSVQECIRCGQCNQACPVNLLPQQLYWHTKNQNINKAMDYNLPDCIECACCDYVCPSHIPLSQYFSLAKQLSRTQILAQNKVDIARERFEFREYRLRRNQQERAEMMALKKAELKKKMANDKTQKDKIAAAMQRVKDTHEGKK